MALPPATARTMTPQQIEQVLDKLIRDVEASVHSFYRGDVRQNTQRIRTDTFRNEAREALLRLSGSAPTPGGTPTAAVPAGASMSPDEAAATMRCVMGWLPMGVPNQASPESRCITAAREITPTWGEREKARLAIKRFAS